MEKLLVINGCEVSVGSNVINSGILDNPTIRNNSFGSILAKHLGRKPVHLSLHDASNDWIARSSAAWVGDNIDKIRNKEIDVIFLVHWSKAEKWEFRFPEYSEPTPFINFHHDYAYKTVSMNPAQTNLKGFQKKLIKWFERIFVEDSTFWSDNKIKNIIFLQELLKHNNCKFWFNHAYDTLNPSITTNSLLNLLDVKYFPHYLDDENTFIKFCEKNNLIHHHKIVQEANSLYAEYLKLEFEKAGL